MILYIHIPFCTSRCGYCTFNSFENKHFLIQDFLSALLFDLRANRTSLPLSSIFFGGGTPNVLDSYAYEKIFKCITTYFKLQKSCEITLEANPNLTTLQWCQELKKLGANRLSFGVQSFYEKKLNFLQRQHHKKDIYNALHYATKAGFDNLSIDLIYDTPLDTPALLAQEINLAASLPINHLSAYSLTIEEESKLYKQGIKEISKSHFKYLKDLLKEQGFTQYEVSNYARDYKVMHNLAYWNYEDYIGCGCGAVGKINNQRFYTHQNIETYIKNPTFRKIETLKPKEIELEKIFLGLRCEIGVETKILNQKKISILEKNHQCYIKNNRLFAKDYFLADEITLFLL